MTLWPLMAAGVLAVDTTPVRRCSPRHGVAEVSLAGRGLLSGRTSPRGSSLTEVAGAARD